MSLISAGHSGAKESVILLHGLARTNRSMVKMAASLKAEGFHTVNQDYPSTDFPIEVLAEKTIEKALKKCPSGNRIHFVTHSLGGILVRQYLSGHTIEHLGRVVMLGPPNQGSQVVDALKNMPGFKLLNGPSGMQLGTDAQSVPIRLGPADFEVGIIAGSRSINLILSTFLPGRDDGKVTIKNTKLEGMADHITLPVSHPFMMRDKTVIRQAIRFLRDGRFGRETDH
ncbi:MAG: alpha/beta fold hydrolase [Desulfobacterales bacterium]|nr:alpha/beta fold hydrolase [Desulfobacterales bacterium]